MAFSDAYKKFLASKPSAQREFRTLEFFHPEFITPLRFVKDFVDSSFLLEADAPRDSLTTQLFTALSMDIVEPSEDLEGTQALTCTIGATNDLLQDKLNLISVLGKFIPIECIYRKFYSGNLLGPELVLYLSITSIDFDGYTKNLIIAEDQDLNSKSSGELYTAERFPGLKNI